MNIEIANRLVNLRKEKNLSQEALAQELGISRQAVSKWERAEASPDTDNLILLARLYGMSLDDLLKTEDEIPKPDSEPETVEGEVEHEGSEKEEYVHIGIGGIHVKDKYNKVHVGWDGIHVHDNKDDVHVDMSPEEAKEWIKTGHHYAKIAEPAQKFPFAVLVIIAYIILGAFTNAWAVSLLIFLLIPLWHSGVSAFYHRDMCHFAYPVLVAGVYVLLGIYNHMWHPGWVLFLTIPVYYSIFGYINSIKKKKHVDIDFASKDSDTYKEY